jgi:hypothetical protein
MRWQKRKLQPKVARETKSSLGPSLPSHSEPPQHGIDGAGAHSSALRVCNAGRLPQLRMAGSRHQRHIIRSTLTLSKPVCRIVHIERAMLSRGAPPSIIE